MREPMLITRSRVQSKGLLKMIQSAIGGDDTYRLLPYLFVNDELQKVVNDKTHKSRFVRTK